MIGFAKDENAVSPIVATLVLIVVAVVGAVSVGTIMGTFSNDVSGQTNTGDISSASATEILIAGSTTVQPVSELLAEAYMKENPGVKITVQGGGSGAGIASAGMGIVDIGSASKSMSADDKEKYPEVQEIQIGASAVVIIVNDDTPLTGNINASTTDLTALYNGSASSITVGGVTFNKPIQRSEESGTEETFAKYLTGEKTIDESVGTGAAGNSGVLKAVQDTAGAIGFVDAGYAMDADGIFILGINDGTNTYTASSANIKAALGGDEDAYPEKLTRPLNYIIADSPSSIVNDYIKFVQSPGGMEYFAEAGMYSMFDF